MKKCKLCNKEFNSMNEHYGNSCIKNLYNNSSITCPKDINNREAFLYSSILNKLDKSELTDKKANYVCESYFSKSYFRNNNYLHLNKIEEEIDNCISDNKKPIMKLNTAYRINKILRRNKSLLNTLKEDSLDKKVDPEIVRFLSSYFSLSKMTNPRYYEVCYYMQLIVWGIIISFGKIKKYPFASQCLSHSVSVIGTEPKDVKYTNKDKYLIKTIKEELGFKKRIKYIINNYQQDGNIDFDGTFEENRVDGTYKFETGDLLYALHSVSISLNGVKKQDKWNLNIKLTDRYDFTEILSNDKYTKNKKEYITLPGLLNDMGTISTTYGVLKGYDIIITFDWSDFIE